MKRLFYSVLFTALILSLIFTPAAFAGRIADHLMESTLTDKYGVNTGGSVSRLSGVSTMDADNVLRHWRGDREQLIEYPHEFDDAWWQKGNATISVDVVVNPINGTTTADKFVEDSANSTHYLSISGGLSVVKGEYYFLSIYAKALERSAIRLQMLEATHRASFNLSTGIHNPHADVVASNMEAVAGYPGWYRCWILTQVTTSGTRYFNVYLENPYETTSYQGDGSSGLYLFGAQLEKLSGPIQGTGVELVTDGVFEAITDDSGEMSSGNLTVGRCYKISARTEQDFTADGAPDNNVGTYFNATGTNVTLDADDKVFPVTFDSWTAGDGWSPQAVSGSLTNKAYCDGSKGSLSNFSQSSVLVVNKYYKITLTVSDYSAGKVRISPGGSSTSSSITANGTYNFYMKCAGLTNLYIQDVDGDFVGTIDSVTVEEVTAPGPLEPGEYTATSGSTASIPAEPPFNGWYQHQVAGINYCLENQDFSDATWAKTNMTTGSATGTDGSSDTIRLTASAANATCLQTITTLSSAEHTTSVYVKRVAGTGAIYLTDNNDTNRTELTGLSTTEWTRYDIQRTQTGPVVGIKIAVDTDAVDVDIFMVEESQSYPSAPIITDDVPVARAAPELSWTTGPEVKATLSDAEGGADSSGTVIFEVNTGYAEADGSGNANFVSWNSSATSGIYIDHAGNTLEITDGTNTATVAFPHAVNTDYTIAAYWDKADDDLNIGFEAAGSWTWGTAQAYDDVQPFGADLEIAVDNEYPFDLRRLVFFDEAMSQDRIEKFEYDGQQLLLRMLLGM